jgi:hypothetical protein
VDTLGLADLSNEKHKLILAMEGVNLRDYSERIHIGSEYVCDDTFAIRAGYKFNYDVESFSFGAGFKFQGAQIDYAFSNFGAILANDNRISIVSNF